mmetsp:Transcript_21607/g.38530  ORF Transcript_21607/g.38530 Transcript_21607/m.38530 type:complete len:95 (-) Transcript_21607:1517-1801(-)
MWDYAPRAGAVPTKPTGSAFDGNARTHVVPDLTSLHASCPVLSGEKWVATKWMRSSFYLPLFYLDVDESHLLLHETTIAAGFAETHNALCGTVT